ncbi:MAG: trypsin-like peptidase domain-containing protein [Clostridiales bacterium]|jgi:serine protease Do|nr:trypsin-like peptidase domain-containing protein [Clostridiales bacterium]
MTNFENETKASEDAISASLPKKQCNDGYAAAMRTFSAPCELALKPIEEQTIQPSVKEAGSAKQPSKRSRFTLVAALAASCVIASGGFGFLGGYAANRISKQEEQSEGIYIAGYEASSAPSLAQAIAATSNDALSLPDIAAATKQSIVEISTEIIMMNSRMRQLITTGGGSGVIIRKDGYIATNYHVINGANSITVRLSDGREYKAAVKGIDSKSDLAVVKIEETNLVPAVIGDSSKIRVGEYALAIGNPLGELGGSVTCGIISALDREIVFDGESMSLFQTDAAVNPGNSGGGLFNVSGQLIGVVNAKSTGSDIEGIGFAIPINTAKPILDDIISYGYARGRVDVGLTLTDIDSAYKAMYYRVSSTGLYISSSSHAELRSGDRILAVDGVEITNLASFNAAMSKRKVGDAVSIAVERNGRQVTVSITLGELHA